MERTRRDRGAPIRVREWVTALAGRGVSPATIRHNKIILSAVFTTALNDLVIALHPCRGVKTPPVPVKEYRILTPEEFDRLRAGLPSPPAQLLVETAVELGLRWGELTELRLRDVHLPSGIVTVSRSVVEVDPKFSPDGQRFVVKPYPKGRRSRRLRAKPAAGRRTGGTRRCRRQGAGRPAVQLRRSGERQPPVASRVAGEVDGRGRARPDRAERPGP